MRYYAQYSGDTLTAIGTGLGGTEITASEYNALLAEIREKADLVDRLYDGYITIDDVPDNWREEIQRRVEERIAASGEVSGQGAEEVYKAALEVLGVETEEVADNAE